VAAVSNLASAAGDWQSVSSRGRAHKSSQWRVSRGAVLQSALGCVKHTKEMFPNRTSLVMADPWCFWGKPTGSGIRAATLEPNVGPPGTKHLEGMQLDRPEDPFGSLGQMLARIEEMRRAQEEENHQFLKALQDPSARRPAPFPHDPSPEPTPKPRDPSELPSPAPQELPSPRTRRSCRLPGPVGAADPRSGGLQLPVPPVLNPRAPTC